MKKRKWINVVLFAFVLSSFVACGSNPSGEKNVSDNQANQSAGSSETGSASETTDIPASPIENSSQKGLPEGYPEAFVIQEGDKISQPNMKVIDGRMSFTMRINTTKTLEQTKEYYQQLLSEALPLERSGSVPADREEFTGICFGYDFIFEFFLDGDGKFINEYYLTLTEVYSEKAFLRRYQMADLPDGYPRELCPVPDATSIYDVRVNSVAEGEEYRIETYTTHTPQEVRDYYLALFPQATISKDESDSISMVATGSDTAGTSYNIYISCHDTSGLDLAIYTLSIRVEPSGN